MANKSRFLALVLRHKPETINIKLDNNGWANIEDIINNSDFTREELIIIVNEDNKSRYELNPPLTKIRAVQGHSIEVDLELKNTLPPYILYHGTSTDIRIHIFSTKSDLLKMSRQYVHLSEDKTTAINVGKRKSNNVDILKIKAREMYNDNFQFYKSKNGVWLTDIVPFKYIDF